jgi:basic amino acid/polyamine antiporter, APA family
MLCQAELASAMPHGGAYYFLNRAFGPVVGTVTGVGLWTIMVLKSAFALVGIGAYIGLVAEVPIVPVAAALACVFLVLNWRGAGEAASAQNVLVLTLLGILTLLIANGGYTLLAETGIDSRRFVPFTTTDASGLLATLAMVFVSYAGLTKVASIAGEVSNPARNLPLGMALALLAAACFYGAGTFLMVSLIPPERLHATLTPAADLLANIDLWTTPTVALGLVIVAALAAFASTANAGIMAGSRYPLAMARDRLLPSGLERIGRRGTPGRSVVITGGAVIVAILAFEVDRLAKLAGAFQLLVFAMLSAAVIVYRQLGGPSYRPRYVAPLYPWLQIGAPPGTRREGASSRAPGGWRKLLARIASCAACLTRAIRCYRRCTVNPLGLLQTYRGTRPC